MPRTRTAMRKVKEVLRLRYDLAMSYSQIRRSCGLSNGTLNGLLARAEKAGLTRWEQVHDLSEEALERRLFQRADDGQWLEERPLPDWAEVERDLRRHKHLTLKLVWGEYIKASPGGYGFSQFCDYFRRWRREQGRGVTLRQEHRPGEALQVDYAGDTVVVMDGGQAREAQVFVACLPFSGLVYTEATWTQQLEDWLASHVRAFSFLGGVPGALVPDNLKSGVTKANFFDPVLNASYYELARHYGTAILPTRVRKPRDKPAAENAVLQVERWVLAPLRHQTFFSLGELNAAMMPLREALNNRPLSPPREGTRRSVFEAEERALLRPLPSDPYVVGQWDLGRTVGADYHVIADGHYYSVPCALARGKVDVFTTATLVTIFQRGERVASHPRSSIKGGHTTLPEHRPPGHRAVLERTPERMRAEAAEIGVATATYVDRLLASRRHVEQGVRAACGVVRLAAKYGAMALEKACERALAAGVLSPRFVEGLLKAPTRPVLPEPIEGGPGEHGNVRGSGYYH
ncbi:MAG TPA: IS21 family transposase [Azospirillum sp.]|nr:IS21 family transposase [Azospirillum sp.]